MCSSVRSFRFEASPQFSIFANQFTQDVVFHLTLIFLPLCAIYAIFMTWQAERSIALGMANIASLRAAYDVNGDGLKIKFQSGDKS